MKDLSIGRRATLLLAFAVGGCSSFISESGPTSGTVVDGATIRIGDAGDQHKLAYALIRVSSNILANLVSVDSPAKFSRGLVDAAPVATGGAIGAGDFVALTIFESGAGGLFVPAEPGTRTGNFVTIPAQQVDSAGRISVPFAGVIKVAGLSPQAVGEIVQNRLADRALEPQVVVTITDRRANAVTVTGDVNASARFTLDPGGERLLGAIARAGGPKYPPYESLVTLQRGTAIERTFLSEVMHQPEQNVALMAGDTIYVARQQRYFLALGALGPGQYLGLVNRRLAFEDTQLSLADAIAKVGGLSDDRANDRAVFLYRFEQKETLGKLGLQLTPDLPPTIPTIYFLDLAETAGYFFANRFPMRNEDLLYVSNAPATDIAKFLDIILPAAYSAANFKTL